MRYSISKVRDFSEIFLNFLGTFSDFEHIYENATLIFKVKNYRNTPPIYRNFRSQ